LGALVAYALTGFLPGTGQLVVAGCAAPYLPAPSAPLHRRPDGALRAALKRWGGLPPEVLRHPELVDLMLPVIRDDIELAEAFRPAEPRPVGGPVLALAGRDDGLTGVAAVAGWRRVAPNGFELHRFPGDHFFVRTAAPEVLGTIRNSLLRTMPPATTETGDR
jgi:medium-chain acyl-[acyl-carrier-protein] hydrolase